jgi:hypothetical protein
MKTAKLKVPKNLKSHKCACKPKVIGTYDPKYLPFTPGYITSMFTYINFCLLMALCLLYLKAYSTDVAYTTYGSFFYTFSIMFKAAYWIMIAYIAQIVIQIIWNLGVWLYGKRNNCKNKA